MAEKGVHAMVEEANLRNELRHTKVMHNHHA